MLVFGGHPKVLSSGNEKLGIGHGAILKRAIDQRLRKL
jgi:hypothetical protein